MRASDKKREVTHGPWKKGERSKVSLMQVFRASFQEKDAQRGRADGDADAGAVSARSKARREGVGEARLREHIQADLTALMNTTRLDAAVDLEDYPHVRGSILNYGCRDLGGVGIVGLKRREIADSIRQSLIDYEPRLIPDSIRIKLENATGDARQFLHFSITAELMGDPVDIPMDFTADVDVGAGKLKLGTLRMQST